MLDYQTKGYSQYGASMGRSSDLPEDTDAIVTVRRVPLDEGGYDPGGAYWGGPSNLYHVTDGERDAYVRASSEDAAFARFPRAARSERVVEPGDVEDAVTGYVRAALWSSCDEDDVPLDDNYHEGDVSEETMARMRADVERFIRGHQAALLRAMSKRERSFEDAGHDLWLTRNGHGCGFWDGDWPEPEAAILTKGAKALGEVWLYVGDDGKIYL